MVWWSAEVIHISNTGSSKQTNGTIRYKAKKKYSAEDYDVSFLHSSSGFKKLVHTNPQMPHCTPWKYNDEPVDDTEAFNLFKRETTVHGEGRTEVLDSISLDASLNQSSSDMTTNQSARRKDASQQAPQSLTRAGKKNQGDSANIQPPMSDVDDERVAKQASFLTSNSPEQQAKVTPIPNEKTVEVRQVQLQQVNSNVGGALLSGFIEEILNSKGNSNNLLDFIHQNLKYDVIQKFSASLTRTKLQNSGLEGYHCSEIIISGKCDMTSFVELVHPLRNRQKYSTNELRFNPDSASFDIQSRATSMLSIDFISLKGLLDWISIRDKSDHLSIAVKSTLRKSDTLLRILGSSIVVTVSDQSDGNGSIDVDCVLPLCSCFNTHVDVLKTALENEFKKQTISTVEVHNKTRRLQDSSNQVVFYRCRRHYDDAQGRYLSPWKAFCITLQELPLVSNNNYDRTQHESLFSIQWTQNRPIASTRWTSDARFTGVQVLGELSLFFPAVTFFGPSTINEIQHLLDMHIL